uniref:RING-type E3 ubiquitin transferase n=1 Tax=Saccoglossus kowalevskii TaxID=10224 RepID=A0ABM0M0T7_SACKO|nr:PREDICTED: SH3 domain-containing RING finger protein 3-like [Saccoglossus kowalevskii]
MDEDSLNDLLECSVCLERLDESSKVLPCQHTFCKRCLEEIVNSRKELRCPECRVLVRCSVDQLPANILLVRLLGGMSSSLVGKRGPPEKPSSKSKQASGRSGHTGSGGRAGSDHQPTTGKTQENTNKPCARGLYNFEGKEPGDLAFHKEDMIYLLKKIDDNWFQGELKGHIGFLPSNYVQVITPLPKDPPQCKALFDFDISDQDEKDCLSFSKDEIFSVIKQVDENWAEGQKGDKIGIFPLSYVERKINVWNKSCSLFGINPANQASHGSAPNSVEEDSRNKSSQKRHSFTLFPNANKGSKDTQRHSMEIGAPVLISCSNPTATTLLETQFPQPSTSSLLQPTPVSQGSSRPPAMQDGILVPIPVLPQRSTQGVTSSDRPRPKNTPPQLVPEQSRVVLTSSGTSGGLSLSKSSGGDNVVSTQQQSETFPIKIAPPPSTRRNSSPNAHRHTAQIVSTTRTATPAVTSTPASSLTEVTSTRHNAPAPPPISSMSTSSTRTQSASVPRTNPTSVSRNNPAPVPRANAPPVPASTTSNSSPDVGSYQPLNSAAAATITPPNKSAIQISGNQSPYARSDKKRDKEKVFKKLQVFKKTRPPPPPPWMVPSGDESRHMRSESLPDQTSLNNSSILADHRKSESLDESAGATASGVSRPPKTAPLVRERYRVIVPYPPQSNEELELKIGDTVYVHKKRDDGWYKGTLQRTGKTGLFPGSFVDKF